VPDACRSCQPPIGRVRDKTLSLAAWSLGDYHRFSMFGAANVKAFPTGIASFAIIAPSVR
jgi:hypothetical protein